MKTSCITERAFTSEKTTTVTLFEGTRGYARGYAPLRAGTLSDGSGREDTRSYARDSRLRLAMLGHALVRQVTVRDATVCAGTHGDARDAQIRAYMWPQPLNLKLSVSNKRL